MNGYEYCLDDGIEAEQRRSMISLYSHSRFALGTRPISFAYWHLPSTVML